MAITKKDIEHIAALARIKLTAAEETKMAEELGAILGYVEKLREVDTTGVEAMAQVTGLENILRPDENPIEPGSQTEKLVGQFPHQKDNFLKVKEVFSNRE